MSSVLPMLSKSVEGVLGRIKRQVAHLIRDERGLAATEFAVIVPLMLTMFFGTVEVTSGIAADRKVSLVARTMADLPSQSAAVSSNDLQSFSTASGAILWPYDPAPLTLTISQIYIDTNQIARITWSKSANVVRSGGTTTAYLKISPRNVGDVVPLATALATPDTYLIWSETSYLYTPAVGYVMGKAGVTLTATSYARPRQSKCVPFTESVGNYTFGTC